MAYQLKVINPVEELTLTDRQSYRQRAINAGLTRAVEKKVAPSQDELVVRHAQCNADFGTTAVLDFWATPVMAAPLGTLVTVFQAIAAPVLAATKVAVFYKVTIGTAPIPVSLIAFREGAAAGTTKAVYDLEQLDGYLIPSGYFSEPVVYDPQQVLNVVVATRIVTGLLCRCILGCYIIEPKGAIIS